MKFKNFTVTNIEALTVNTILPPPCINVVIKTEPIDGKFISIEKMGGIIDGFPIKSYVFKYTYTGQEEMRICLKYDARTTNYIEQITAILVHIDNKIQENIDEIAALAKLSRDLERFFKVAP